MTTLIPKFDVKNGGSTPSGAVNRPINEKLGESVSVKDFGAKGDGTTDDTVAINAALASLTSGGIVFMPAGTYKTTGSIVVGNNAVTLQGYGKQNTIIKPVGTFDAIQVNGTSFNSWADARSVRDLTIDGSNGCTGNGLSIINCGLRCYFADIYIINMKGSPNSATGCGMYISSSFDHNYDRIETRANASYGIYVFEKQSVPDGVYEEVSNLIFHSCWAIANNSAGIQWNFAGGDTCCILECKPSEGSIGLAFTRNCNSHKITNLFYDSPGAAGTGIACQTNTNYCFNLYFNGIHSFNAQYGLNVVDGQNIFCQNFDGATTQVNVGSSATGYLYLGQNVTYTDARSTPKTYPTDYFGSWTPTFAGTGSSLGNGTLLAQYTLNGNALTFQLNLTFGSTSVMGAGAGFSTPFPASTGYAPVTAVAYHVATTTWYSFQAYIVSGSIIFPYGSGFLNGSTPFTWATGDLLAVSGTYRIFE